MKTLIIVDYQYDFYHPLGGLYVAGGETLEDKIAAIMPQYDHIIFTLDWHPTTHCSFASNGGPWPEHCVQYSCGAGISKVLLKAAADSGATVTFYQKGFRPEEEEYGAFAELLHPEQQRHTDGQEPRALFVASHEIAVCGLAGGFCVNQTIENLIHAGYHDRIVLLRDCTGLICTPAEFQQFLADNHVAVR